ncbi:MAG: hypothetical protein ACXWUG_30845, partial [Polyangiales bacterium]
MRHVCFASVVTSLALVACGSERQIDDSTLVRHDASVGDTTEGDPDGGGASDGFDLDADAPGGCMAKTCAALGANCGPVADGCGGILDCGKCTAPEACGGGGKANVCGGGGGPCVPKTCADVGADCGPIG